MHHRSSVEQGRGLTLPTEYRGIKAKVLELLQLGSFNPVVHISGRYAADKNCLAIVLPVCKHPTNTNGIIVYDLSIDPEPMLSLSIEDIQQRLFTATMTCPKV